MRQQQHAMRRFYHEESETLAKREEAKAEAWLSQVWVKAEAQAEKEVASLRAMQRRLAQAMDRRPEAHEQLWKMEAQLEEAQASALAGSQQEARGGST